MWAIFRLRSNFQGSLYKMCGVFLGGIGGWVGDGRGTRSRSNSGYHDLGLLQLEIVRRHYILSNGRYFTTFAKECTASVFQG